MNGEAINLCSWAYPVPRERAQRSAGGPCPLHPGLSSILCPKPGILKLPSPETHWALRLSLYVGLDGACAEVEEVLLSTSARAEPHIWTLAGEWVLLCSWIKRGQVLAWLCACCWAVCVYQGFSAVPPCTVLGALRQHSGGPFSTRTVSCVIWLWYIYKTAGIEAGTTSGGAAWCCWRHSVPFSLLLQTIWHILLCWFEHKRVGDLCGLCFIRLVWQPLGSYYFVEDDDPPSTVVLAGEILWPASRSGLILFMAVLDLFRGKVVYLLLS